MSICVSELCGLLIQTSLGSGSGMAGLWTNRSGWAKYAASRTVWHFSWMAGAWPKWTMAGFSGRRPPLARFVISTPKQPKWPKVSVGVLSHPVI